VAHTFEEMSPKILYLGRKIEKNVYFSKDFRTRYYRRKGSKY